MQRGWIGKVLVWCALVAVALGTVIADRDVVASGPSLSVPMQSCYYVETCEGDPAVGLTCTYEERCPGDEGYNPTATPLPTPTPGPTATPGPSPTPAPTSTPTVGPPLAGCDPDPENCEDWQTRPYTWRIVVGLGGMSRKHWIGDCCELGCPCDWPEEPEEPEPGPCEPAYTTACSELGATVSAELPVWYANRNPYPRGMVTVDELFWTSNAAGNYSTSLNSVTVWGDTADQVYDWGENPCECRAEGTCDDDPPPEGWKCSFQLGLSAQPVGGVAPTWACQEAESGGGSGWLTSCVWEYSSWGKPELGRGIDCEPLPAFAVTASVPYYWYFARQWDEWEEDATVGWGECGCSGEMDQADNQGWRPCDGEEIMETWAPGERGTPTEGQCFGVYGSPPDQYWGSYWTSIPGWVHHGPEWERLDLTLYGFSTPYILNPRVQLAPSRACSPHPVGVLYVPVIEVQGLISKP